MNKWQLNKSVFALTLSSSVYCNCKNIQLSLFSCYWQKHKIH